MLSYDITVTKRRQRVAKTLERYGIRVQKSFFQCEMPKADLQKLKKELLTIIDRKRDSLFIYPMCEKCSKEVWRDGSGNILVIRSFEIL